MKVKLYISYCDVVVSNTIPDLMEYVAYFFCGKVQISGAAMEGLKTL